MRISDWSSDVCSSDLRQPDEQVAEPPCRNLQRLRHVGSKLGLVGVTLGIAREQRELARPILDVVHDEGEAAIEFVEPPRLGQRLLALRFGEMRSEEQTYELLSRMRITYAVLCLETKQ